MSKNSLHNPDCANLDYLGVLLVTILFILAGYLGVYLGGLK